jgi:hypothetical protein
MGLFRRMFSKPTITSGGSTIKKYTQTDNSAQLGFSNVPSEWQQLRDSHYRKWFGDSENARVWHEVVPVIPHIDIHVFPPSTKLGRNYFTLITSGMSDEKMNLPKGVDKQFARAEIIFYVSEDETRKDQTEKPWYVEAISFYAHFPFNFKTWLAFSHTLPNGNPPAPVVEGSILTTAIFLPAIFEPNQFTQDFKLDDEKVNFLWLTYLSDKETEFKLNDGMDKLADEFNQDNFPKVFNPFRKSIV